MRFVLSSITKKRPVGKANTRIYPRFQKLSSRLEALDLENNEYDAIIVSIADEPDSFYREIKNRDKIFQVEIGYPEGLSFRPQDDDRLVNYIVSRLERILPKCPVSPSDREKVMVEFNEWKKSLGLA